MRRVLVFGNSGSGKSTLAKSLCESEQLAHLDLDTLAWLPTAPPQRKPLGESEALLLDFIGEHEGWVIEGCYTDLLELAAPFCNEMRYLDLPVEACIANAHRRPWEPHKYASKAEQDDNLPMLIEWIGQYPERTDTFSASAHRRLYDGFTGRKYTYSSNDRRA